MDKEMISSENTKLHENSHPKFENYGINFNLYEIKYYNNHTKIG